MHSNAVSQAAQVTELVLLSKHGSWSVRHIHTEHIRNGMMDDDTHHELHPRSDQHDDTATILS